MTKQTSLTKTSTATIRGRTYQVQYVTELPEITERLAADMRSRGFDAYGFVDFPRGKNSVVQRVAATGEWIEVVKV